jgi:hypothetical protein
MDWLRLYAEFATDPKVQMMSEAMQRRLIMLFCLQCSNGIETFHVTERETSIAFALRISDDEIALTKAEFQKRGFINDDWTLRNWGKRQYASDSSTARVRRHREAKKQEATQDGNEVKRFSNALEQIQNREEQKTLSAGADSPAQEGEGEKGDQRQRTIPVKDILAAYHEHLPMMPAVRVMTDARKRKLKARWTEDASRQSAEYWQKFFGYVAKSDFLTGRDGRWTGCDFEWLIEAGNHVKVIEGKYENREAQA